MFELPEVLTLSRQMNVVLAGKTIQRGQLGNAPHKFVWYDRGHAEFEELTRGRTVGETWARGKWLFVPLEPGYVLLFGEWGGRVVHNDPGTPVPEKYHLLLRFRDGSSLTARTRMWGAVELHNKGEEFSSKYLQNMNFTPIDDEFTLDHLRSLVRGLGEGKGASAKALLTQNQIIPGLGNAIAQDILFRAGIHPRRSVLDLDSDGLERLFRAIVDTVSDVIAGGGRYDEFDLHNRPGRYVRIMDKHALRRPCPECGGPVSRIQYLGGSCYFCPRCQS